MSYINLLLNKLETDQHTFVNVNDENGNESENFFNSVVKPTLLPFMVNKDLVDFETYSALTNSLNHLDKNTIPLCAFSKKFPEVVAKISDQFNRLNLQSKIIFNYYLYLNISSHETQLSASELRDRIANCETINLGETHGGFFFKGPRTRKKSKKKKKQIKTLKNKKCRKWTDTSFPYRGTTRAKAIDEFLKLKKMAKSDINPKSSIGRFS